MVKRRKRTVKTGMAHIINFNCRAAYKMSELHYWLKKVFRKYPVTLQQKGFLYFDGRLREAKRQELKQEFQICKSEGLGLYVPTGREIVYKRHCCYDDLESMLYSLNHPEDEREHLILKCGIDPELMIRCDITGNKVRDVYGGGSDPYLGREFLRWVYLYHFYPPKNKPKPKTASYQEVQGQLRKLKPKDIARFFRWATSGYKKFLFEKKLSGK